MSRRIYDRREGRKSEKFIDRTGMISHRLLYLEWLGRWGKRTGHWWKALCECGTLVEAQWRPSDVKSCGCLQREVRKVHGWETQRPDGRWGLKNQKRLMVDGQPTTIALLAKRVGVHKRVMERRVERWPQERWLEPPHATGLRPAKIVKTSWHRRPQPWASGTMKRINEEGLAYRKTKPSAEPLAAGPGQDAGHHPSPDHAAAPAPDAAGESPER